MTEITIELARKAIAEARRIEAERTQGNWEHRYKFGIRVSHTPVVKVYQCGKRPVEDACAVSLWAGAFSALLHVLESELLVIQPKTFWEAREAEQKAIAALISTLDRVSPGWRERE